jgi:hypothetical protein
MLKGQFIGISTYTNKAETSQANNQMVNLKLVEKHEQTQTRGRKTIKKVAEINDTKTKKTYYTKNQFNKMLFL